MSALLVYSVSSFAQVGGPGCHSFSRESTEFFVADSGPFAIHRWVPHVSGARVEVIFRDREQYGRAVGLWNSFEGLRWLTARADNPFAVAEVERIDPRAWTQRDIFVAGIPPTGDPQLERTFIGAGISRRAPRLYPDGLRGRTVGDVLRDRSLDRSVVASIVALYSARIRSLAAAAEQVLGSYPSSLRVHGGRFGADIPTLIGVIGPLGAPVRLSPYGVELGDGDTMTIVDPI